MRVLMLGWEFPPFISGGLGTACYGLTKAMSGIGTDIMFVLPRPVATPFSTHVKLVSPREGSPLAISYPALFAALVIQPSGDARFSSNVNAMCRRSKVRVSVLKPITVSKR